MEKEEENGYYVNKIKCRGRGLPYDERRRRRRRDSHNDTRTSPEKNLEHFACKQR